MNIALPWLCKLLSISRAIVKDGLINHFHISLYAGFRRGATKMVTRSACVCNEPPVYPDLSGLPGQLRNQKSIVIPASLWPESRSRIPKFWIPCLRAVGTTAGRPIKAFGNDNLKNKIRITINIPHLGSENF